MIKLLILALACHWAFAAKPRAEVDCANLLAQFEPLTVAKVKPLARRPVGYQKTEKQFRNEAKQAIRKYGKIFSPPQIEPEVYRIDARPPEEIIKAGGFFPNPKKKKGTLAEHTIGWGNTGGGSYVSSSWQSDEKFMWRLFQKRIRSPDYVIVNGAMIKDQKIPLDKIYKPGEKMPEWSVIEFYEYRARDVLGVRVAGDHEYENESIVRGIPLSNGIEVRKVLLKAKLTPRKQINFEWMGGKPVKGGMELLAPRGQFLDSNDVKFEYSEWVRLRP